MLDARQARLGVSMHQCSRIFSRGAWRGSCGRGGVHAAQRSRCRACAVPGHAARSRHQLLAGVPHAAGLGHDDHGGVVGLRHRVQQLKLKRAQQHRPDRLDLQVCKVLALQVTGRGQGGESGKVGEGCVAAAGAQGQAKLPAPTQPPRAPCSRGGRRQSRGRRRGWACPPRAAAGSGRARTRWGLRTRGAGGAKRWATPPQCGSAVGVGGGGRCRQLVRALQAQGRAEWVCTRRAIGGRPQAAHSQPHLGHGVGLAGGGGDGEGLLAVPHDHEQRRVHAQRLLRGYGVGAGRRGSVRRRCGAGTQRGARGSPHNPTPPTPTACPPHTHHPHAPLPGCWCAGRPWS